MTGRHHSCQIAEVHRNIETSGIAALRQTSTSAELLEILGGARSELGGLRLTYLTSELCRRTNRRDGS